MSVWIAQCLCPQRHSILAASVLADNEPEAIHNGIEPLRDSVGEFLDTEWTQSVAAIARSGERPGCFRCKKALIPVEEGGDGIGGIAVMLPRNANRGDSGLVAAFCPSCGRLGRDGRDALLPYLREVIEKETGLAALDVH